MFSRLFVNNKVGSYVPEGIYTDDDDDNDDGDVSKTGLQDQTTDSIFRRVKRH